MNDIYNDYRPEVASLLAALFEHGFSLTGIDNGDGPRITEPRILGSIPLATGEICAVDESRIYLTREGAGCGIFIVLGNEPGVIAADYSGGPGIMAYIDHISTRHYLVWDGVRQPKASRGEESQTKAWKVEIPAGSDLALTSPIVVYGPSFLRAYEQLSQLVPMSGFVLTEIPIPPESPSGPCKLGDVLNNPRDIGTSAYRAAADLATTVASLGADAEDCDFDELLSADALKAISDEMEALIEAAESIKAGCEKRIAR